MRAAHASADKEKGPSDKVSTKRRNKRKGKGKGKKGDHPGQPSGPTSARPATTSVAPFPLGFENKSQRLCALNSAISVLRTLHANGTYISFQEGPGGPNPLQLIVQSNNNDVALRSQIIDAMPADMRHLLVPENPVGVEYVAYDRVFGFLCRTFLSAPLRVRFSFEGTCRCGNPSLEWDDIQTVIVDPGQSVTCALVDAITFSAQKHNPACKENFDIDKCGGDIVSRPRFANDSSVSFNAQFTKPKEVNLAELGKTIVVQDVRYRPVAIVMNPNGNHFTCYSRGLSGGWYLFDDDKQPSLALPQKNVSVTAVYYAPVSTATAARTTVDAAKIDVSAKHDVTTSLSPDRNVDHQQIAADRAKARSSTLVTGNFIDLTKDEDDASPKEASPKKFDLRASGRNNKNALQKSLTAPTAKAIALDISSDEESSPAKKKEAAASPMKLKTRQIEESNGTISQVAQSQIVLLPPEAVKRGANAPAASPTKKPVGEPFKRTGASKSASSIPEALVGATDGALPAGAPAAPAVPKTKPSAKPSAKPSDADSKSPKALSQH